MAAGTTNRWKLGLFVVTGVLATFGAVIWLGTAQLRRHTDKAVTYFDESVQGLGVGSDVKIRGIPIGKVKAIGFAPDQRHVQVDMSLDVDQAKRIGLPGKRPKDEDLLMLRVQLASQGITGLMFLNLDVAQEGHPAEKMPFPVGEGYIPSAPSVLKSLSDAAMEAAAHLPELGDTLKNLMKRIDGAIVDADVPGLSSRIKGTLETIDSRMQAIDAAMLTTRTAGTLDEAAMTLRWARQAGATVTAQLEAVRRDLETLSKAGEAAVREAEVGRTTASVRETAKSFTLLGDEMRAQLAELRDAVDAIRRLADMLERDPGALLHGKSPETVPQGRSQ